MFKYNVSFKSLAIRELVIIKWQFFIFKILFFLLINYICLYIIVKHTYKISLKIKHEKLIMSHNTCTKRYEEFIH